MTKPEDLLCKKIIQTVCMNCLGQGKIPIAILSGYFTTCSKCRGSGFIPVAIKVKPTMYMERINYDQALCGESV